MPIHILELVMKAIVTDEPDADTKTERGEQAAPADNEAIIQECLERMGKIVNQRLDR